MPIIGQLKGDDLKAAYNVGCTFNQTGMNPMDQYVYICKDCEKESTSFDEANICACCAIFCHAGHEIVQIANKQKVKAVCDCGGGLLDGVKSLNSKSPLKDILKDDFVAHRCGLKASSQRDDGDMVANYISRKHKLGLVKGDG